MEAIDHATGDRQISSVRKNIRNRGIARASALAIGAILSLGAAGPPALSIGSLAPPFQVTLIDGSTVTSEQLRGKVVVLNFWATWCVPCREELPLLDNYYSARKDQGLRIFAIATEESVPASRMKTLFAHMRMPSARRIRGKYDIIGGLPTSYIIDRAGRIRYAGSGAFTPDTLNARLVPLLKEPVPAD